MNTVPTPSAPGAKPERKRPGPKPGGKGKAPSLESETGKLFLSTFLLPPDHYPLRLPQNMPRGKAINLSVGLNRVNKAYWKLDDPTVPKWVANLSAKAKAVSGQAETSAARAACRAGLPVPDGGDWYVEISESYIRTGNPSPARRENVEWLKGLVAQVEEQTKEVRDELAREEAERAERLRLAKEEKAEAPYRKWASDAESAPTRPGPVDEASAVLDKLGYGLDAPTAAKPTQPVVEQPETALPHSAPALPWLLNGGPCTPLEEEKTVLLTKAEVEARLAEGQKP